MIIVQERRGGRWRSLSRSDVEDVSEEVALRGRLEGVFSWAKKRLEPGDRISIEIEDKADLRVRRYRKACVMAGSVRPSLASMFTLKDDPDEKLTGSMDGIFTRALDRLAEKPVEIKSEGMIFRLRKKDRRLAFAFLKVSRF